MTNFNRVWLFCYHHVRVLVYCNWRVQNCTFYQHIVCWGSSVQTSSMVVVGTSTACYHSQTERQNSFQGDQRHHTQGSLIQFQWGGRRLVRRTCPPSPSSNTTLHIRGGLYTILRKGFVTNVRRLRPRW